MSKDREKVLRSSEDGERVMRRPLPEPAPVFDEPAVVSILPQSLMDMLAPVEQEETPDITLISSETLTGSFASQLTSCETVEMFDIFKVTTKQWFIGDEQVEDDEYDITLCYGDSSDIFNDFGDSSVTIEQALFLAQALSDDTLTEAIDTMLAKAQEVLDEEYYEMVYAQMEAFLLEHDKTLEQ